MAQYDGSHDFQHIERVLSLARTIHASEMQGDKAMVGYDKHVIELAATLHDVGDKKYLKAGEDPANMVLDVLKNLGADETLARKVQDIVTHVSYTSEVANPAKVQQVLARTPELAVVQDADRLDALGAVGIGRCFLFGGAKGRDMPNCIAHFEEKLEKLGSMMKTSTGRDMAKGRTHRLVMFRDWFMEESIIVVNAIQP